jgi:hypothetical protein
VDLGGPEQTPIILTGLTLRSSQFIRLDGEKGTAYCTETASGAICLVSFNLHDFNMKEHFEFLKKRYPDPKEQLAKLQVAQVFGDQPGGFLQLSFEKR